MVKNPMSGSLMEPNLVPLKTHKRRRNLVLDFTKEPWILQKIEVLCESLRSSPCSSRITRHRLALTALKLGLEAMKEMTPGEVQKLVNKPFRVEVVKRAPKDPVQEVITCRIISDEIQCWESRYGRPRNGQGAPPSEFYNERKVESALVEPFLIRLGYKADEWSYQIRVRSERGTNVAPDYLIGWSPQQSTSNVVVEVKRKVHGLIHFMSVVKQLKSYAAILRPKASVVLASNGIWMFDRKVSSYNYTTWHDIEDPLVFRAVKCLIGPMAIRVSSEV